MSCTNKQTKKEQKHHEVIRNETYIKECKIINQTDARNSKLNKAIHECLRFKEIPK